MTPWNPILSHNPYPGAATEGMGYEGVDCIVLYSVSFLTLLFPLFFPF